MKSEELGLPIEYQLYPEYFDTASNALHADEKNKIIETILAKYKTKHVLDMTCGTGSQVFYLMNRGYHVIGADFSPGLLKIARSKALKQNIVVEFVDGDMRYSQLGQFDAVITIDNAIGHLIKADFEIALQNIYKNLKSNGIYIFDILNLDAMTDEVIELDSKKMTNSDITQDGATIHHHRQSYLDRKNGLLTADEIITIQKNNHEKKIKNTCAMQIYAIDHLNELLLRNGFVVLEQHKIDTYTFQKDNQGYGSLTVAKESMMMRGITCFKIQILAYKSRGV